MTASTVPARIQTLGRDRLAFPAGSDGTAYRHALADMVDQALAELFETALEKTGHSSRGVALAVVGSLGRREAGPASDLDCVLIHDGAGEIAPLADAIWYPIWDAGLRLDHSVRTLAECRRIASADLPAALGFLDLRFVAGDETVAMRAQSAVLRDWRKAARRRLPELLNSVTHRAEKFGELAYLIEPDLKEARGGLRDAVVINALVATWLTERPHGALDRQVTQLLDIRDALQRVTGRHSNRMVLADLDDVAAELAMDGTHIPSVETGADELLATIGECARVISAALDATARNAKRTLRRPSASAVLAPRIVRGRRKAPILRSLGRGLVEHDGDVVLSVDSAPASDPVLPLRAGAVAVRTGLPISPPTLESLRAAADLPVPWPAEARSEFLSILQGGSRMIPVIESLDLAGLMTRWIPEWTYVRNRPQRAAIHRHTVDRHLVQTAANAHLPAGRDGEILALAAFLHDIGKVPGGQDHSTVGAKLVPGILTRMGFTEYIADIEFLVRYHLLLSETATRQDPQDPAVVASVAEIVGDRRRLELLHALTEADASAVGPKAWTPWRASLVADLVKNVAVRLP